MRNTSKERLGFTMAEALVMLLVTSLIIIATMPVITKRVRHRLDYKFGPSDGWECRKAEMPCSFSPPAKSKNFTIYFDDNKVPSFSSVFMGQITIVAAAPKLTEEVYHPPVWVEKTDVQEGYGVVDSSWDKVKETTPMPEETTITNYEEQQAGYYETVVLDPGGCKTTPELFSSFEAYTKQNVIMKGTFCTGAEKVRIVY